MPTVAGNPHTRARENISAEADTAGGWPKATKIASACQITTIKGAEMLRVTQKPWRRERRTLRVWPAPISWATIGPTAETTPIANKKQVR